jgi:PAS domain S-box-containing protein
MTHGQQAALRELLKRVDEVRGLSVPSDIRGTTTVTSTEALIEILAGLVDELERSHRRLIETNVQLVSLREVANRLVSTLDTGETTRIVARYLHRAFGFESAFLGLVERESQTLVGTWTHGRGGPEHSIRLELPLVGERGALARSLWLNQAVLLRDPQRHVPAALGGGHPLAERFARLGSFASVPLQRSHSVLPAGQTHELCGERCVLGDPLLLAPPPGGDSARWAIEREERQRQCLGCELFPLLGVIGAARDADSSPLTPTDLSLLESIALSVAPIVENARLYQELRRSERFRDHVLNSMQSAVATVNLTGEVLALNRAAVDLTGYESREVVGRTAAEVFGADLSAVLDATLEHGREFLRRTTRLVRRDGAALDVSLTTSLLRDDRRQVYGVIATLVDLAPLRRAEEQARQLDRLAALGRFTSSVAHEIRNPLTGIAAGIQYLSRALPAHDEHRENLSFIQSEIRRLDGIVQQLFDITHPKKMAPRVAPLSRAVERAVQSLQVVIEQRGVRVELDSALEKSPVAHDADQMQQVFINLIKNAAEASPIGAVVRVALENTAGTPEEASGEWLLVVVEDRGHGIRPEDLETVFEPFFTTKEGGTGLGLYVTHDIVKRHGGRLRVKSQPGQGTTFVVELPWEPKGGTP